MYYFDWTATTPISENSLSEYVSTSRDYFGNPSSEHTAGNKAASLLEELRNKTANLININSSDLYFTSGGTESDSIIMNSLLLFPNPKEVLVSAIEHSAILEHKTTLESHGWKFTKIKCPNGFIDLEDLKQKLNPNVKMVCIMAVNNVTGTIQDYNSIIKTIRNYESQTGRKIHIHCDAVQALGKININSILPDIDSAAFSSHKIFGPRGIGILYNRDKSILSLSKGGGQEKGLRPGTENLPATAAMVKSMEDELCKIDEHFSYVNELNNKLRKVLKDNGIKIISPEKNTSPYILSISVSPIPSQVFLRVMNDNGFCLSAGSACSSNSKGKAESVLTAMNIRPEDRMSSIRISLSHKNTIEETIKLSETIVQKYKEFTNGK